MKTTILRSLLLWSAGMFPLMALADIGDPLTRVYFRVEGGGALSSDTELKQFFGDPFGTGSKVKFNPGPHVTFATGYNVTDWFAAEFETGFIANEVDSISDAWALDDTTVTQVPFLVNVRFRPPGRWRVSPFIGGGAGGSAAVLDTDFIGIGLTSLEGSASDAVFAYQAFAGLRCDLNERMALSVQYHYFATLDPTWEADLIVGPGSDTMRFGGMESHIITLGFTMGF